MQVDAEKEVITGNVYPSMSPAFLNQSSPMGPTIQQRSLVPSQHSSNCVLPTQVNMNTPMGVEASTASFSYNHVDTRSLTALPLSAPPGLTAESRELVELLGQAVRFRADNFCVDEVKMLLEEVKPWKNIILSISPSANRRKRRAWEEIANSMANRCPDLPRRTADQVRRKWENLVSSTKRKLREGRMTADEGWSETNRIITQFMLQHKLPVRVHHSPSALAGLMDYNSTPTVSNMLAITGNPVGPQSNEEKVEIEDVLREAMVSEPTCETSHTTSHHDSSVTVSRGGQMFESTSLHPKPTHDVESTASWACETGTTTMSFSSPMVNANHQPDNAMGSLLHSPLCNDLFSSTTALVSSFNNNLQTSQEIQKQLLEQVRQEQDLRLQILRLQRDAWQLQVDLLTRAKESTNYRNSHV